ncbi:MAG: hypothetical protein HFH15_09365 [Ruminococcus sp.]|nr:hypothetical protein [Ruminococcus sp.]
MKKVNTFIIKTVKIVGILSVLFFAVSFTVYFFNLDMKLTAALEPYLEKWHDRVKRERKL